MPAARTTAAMSRTVEKSGASGFSVNRGFPADATAPMSSRWNRVGATTATASTVGSPMRSAPAG